MLITFDPRAQAARELTAARKLAKPRPTLLQRFARFMTTPLF